MKPCEICGMTQHSYGLNGCVNLLLHEVNNLQNERDRYREALEAVASHDWGYVIGYDVAEGSYHIDAQKVARAALDSEGGETS